MDNTHKVEAICKERSDLRSEMIGFEQSMHKAMFSFIALLAVFAGLYWKKEIVPDDTTRRSLLIVITQLQFFLALFVVGIAHCVTVAAAYIGALEKKINELADETISLWDSKVSPAYITSVTSPFNIAMALQTLFLVGFFGASLFLALTNLRQPVLIGAAITEVLVILLLLGLSGWQRSRTIRLAGRELEHIAIKTS